VGKVTGDDKDARVRGYVIAFVKDLKLVQLPITP
jgi:hypothetical protein